MNNREVYGERPELGSWHHPADDLEIQESDRELIDAAFKKARFVMDRAIAHILDSQDIELATWQISFALGSPACMGLTMAQKADELGVGKAAISKGATAFCRSANIEPSPYMLSRRAQQAYRDLRNEQEKERHKKT